MHTNNSPNAAPAPSPVTAAGAALSLVRSEQAILIDLAHRLAHGLPAGRACFTAEQLGALLELDRRVMDFQRQRRRNFAYGVASCAPNAWEAVAPEEWNPTPAEWAETCAVLGEVPALPDRA